MAQVGGGLCCRCRGAPDQAAVVVRPGSLDALRLALQMVGWPVQAEPAASATGAEAEPHEAELQLLLLRVICELVHHDQKNADYLLQNCAGPVGDSVLFAAATGLSADADAGNFPAEPAAPPPAGVVAVCRVLGSLCVATAARTADGYRFSPMALSLFFSAVAARPGVPVGSGPARARERFLTQRPQLQLILLQALSELCTIEPSALQVCPPELKVRTPCSYKTPRAVC